MCCKSEPEYETNFGPLLGRIETVEGDSGGTRFKRRAGKTGIQCWAFSK
jgi:hypothetical protein